jgi:hypothetical protein
MRRRIVVTERNTPGSIGGGIGLPGGVAGSGGYEGERAPNVGLGWGRVSEAGVAVIVHEGEGVLLLGRRHGCCAWFGLKCRRVEIEDEERGTTRDTVASWGVDVFAATSEARTPETHSLPQSQEDPVPSSSFTSC